MATFTFEANVISRGYHLYKIHPAQTQKWERESYSGAGKEKITMNKPILRLVQSD